MEDRVIRTLFVCLGNICRSPTAEAVFRDQVKKAGYDSRIETDSAGTIGYHEGLPPDNRAQATARGRGIDMSDLRGRKVVAQDFESFDYVLAMDNENFADLKRICPAGREGRLRMFLDFAAERTEREVPDPYYGGDRGFDHVFDLVTDASLGLLSHIRAENL